MRALGYSEVLQRRVRLGSWEDQKVSTHRRVLAALETGRADDAVALAQYFRDEAEVCWALYRQWIADLRTFLVDRGVADARLDERQERIRTLVRLPDGTAFDSDAAWARLGDLINAVGDQARAGDLEGAAATMELARETWRQTHDRDVDTAYGYMSLVTEALGDDAVPDMFARVLEPLFAWRYGKFDIDLHPWDEALETLLYVAFEAMRGHLVGPDRFGDIDLTETEDRYVLTFRPCGSGGRITTGDMVEGTPARTEPPYGWRVATEPRDWNHFTPGVCLYCAHCIILMEQMPMDRFGYPVRVIDPPVAGTERADRCSWTMYKDPTAVPAEHYTRAGRTKPDRFGSEAHGGRVMLPDPTTIALPGRG